MVGFLFGDIRSFSDGMYQKIGKARSFPKFLADGSCCTRVDVEKS